MDITHQDIADRLAEIDRELERFEASRDKERQGLVELCGGIGHKFGAPQKTFGITLGADDMWHSEQYSIAVCSVCGHEERC